MLDSGAGLDFLMLRQSRGWIFTAATLTETSSPEAWASEQHEKTEVVARIRNGIVDIASAGRPLTGRSGDVLIMFGPAPTAPEHGDA